MMKVLITASLLVAAPIPAFAQDNAPSVNTPTPDIDPARLAAARIAVNYIFPDGTYAKIMNGSMEGLMKSAMDSVGTVPLKQLAVIGGMKEADLAKLGDANLRQIMEIVDPNFNERSQNMMHTMMHEMGAMMTKFEPTIQDGLARAYARKYTVDQLGELNRFFATPTGNAYAANAMAIFMDPEVVGKMKDIMPELMKQLPDIIGKVIADDTNLPRPKTYDDLTPAERSKLAQLLGIPETELAQKHQQKH